MAILILLQQSWKPKAGESLLPVVGYGCEQSVSEQIHKEKSFEEGGLGETSVDRNHTSM